MVEELGFETVCKLFPLLDPEPYEDDVRKHQSGKHDQKLHGSWSDGSSDLPDGWTQQSEESRIQEFISRQRAEGSSDTDEWLTRVYGRAFPNTDEYAGLNNSRVVVSRDAKVSDDDLSTQLKTVTDLQRIAPVQDLRVEIGDEAFRFAQLDDGVGGFVVNGGQTIYLRSSSVTDGIDLSKGNLMRVLDKKRYALVHEYGHVLDQRSDSTSSEDKGNVLAGAQTGASRYALSEEPLGASGREAFAEAWTGWVGSQGTLAEPFRDQQSFVGYYADKYGWDAGGEGRSPSAGFAKAQGRMIIADTFTDEGSIVEFLPEDVVVQFAPGLVSVLKHAVHDQLSHGRWARSMRGYEERTPSGRGQRSRGSSEAPSDQARREAIENVDYIMGRTTRAPDWTGPSDPLYVPARSLGDRVQSARRKIAAWRQSRDRRSMERMTSAELETLGAKNRERARRKREKLGLPPFVSKSFDPVYEILQRIFVDAVEPSLWVELVEDPRSLVDLTGPLGDLVDDMLNAVVPLGSVVKFAPGLRPVLKHQAGKHDQKKHGSWSDQAGVQKAADMWVGGTEKFSYQMVNEIRGTARVLRGDNDYYPKDDSRGDPTEVFDSTKSLLLEIADAPPSDVPLYRGLNLNSYDGIGAQILEKGTVFEELAASWTPDQNIADQFATGEIAGRNTFLLAITLRVEKLPAVQMMEHYSGDKSGIIGQADERVASGKYRVENVNSLGDGKYLVDVSFQGLPFDPEVVRNTEYTGGRSTFQPRRSAIVRKSAESDLAARMSLDIDTLVVKHQSGKHDQKTHGVWAAGAGSSDAASRAREAALTGGPTGLTADDLPEMGSNPASYGLVMTENDETIQRLTGFMPNEDMAVRGKLKVIEDGFLIREKRQEMAQQALDYMHPDQIKNATALYDMARTEGKVMVAAPVDAAQKIMDSGRFQTLFETKTSGGSVNFDARLREEFASHDLHPNTTGDKRLVYGYVAFDKPNVGSVWQYGETYFELKPEVKSRTTMTDGDSLGSRATPVPMTGPSLTPIEVAGVSLGWNPMSERAYGDLRVSESPKTIYDNYSDESYFETQIKGGVTLSDVKRIHVPNLFDFDGIPVVNTESYRKLLEVAEERGIEVVQYGTIR